MTANPTFLSAPVGGATLRIHDDVAAGHNADTGIIGRKNKVVCQQLSLQWAQRPMHEPLQVVDLGVGDGALLARRLYCINCNRAVFHTESIFALLPCSYAGRGQASRYAEKNPARR